MVVKETKTEPELSDLILREVRQTPGCDDIAGVRIVPRQGGSANWDAQFTMTASRSGPWPLPPPSARAVVQRLQAQFDLV
jgi:hypothetical protein